MSPRTHYFLAKLFKDAGFPPGVLNFLLHRPQDAAEIFGLLINATPVRKCNFTGSTAVGRTIARTAGNALKPVLLELGGNNCSIVLPDADLGRAAQAIISGASLNNGQICMSTDLVFVVESAAATLREALHEALQGHEAITYPVMTARSHQKIRSLVEDAVALGAKTSVSPDQWPDAHISFTVLDEVTPEMQYYQEESFGPLLGLCLVRDGEEAVSMVNASGYGLSSSIWTRDHLKALEMARKLNVGAVHINASTVHDESTLPHGGQGLSDYGRFGGTWGLREFVQTKTTILHP